jgi:hypothetical protein
MFILADWTDWLDSVTNFFNWLTWQNLINLLRDAFVHAFEWLWNFIGSAFGTVWSGLEAAVSTVVVFITMLQSAAAPLSPYFNFVNAWFPLDVLVALATAYSTFWVGLVTYRFIKSWIPTVSGGG